MPIISAEAMETIDEKERCYSKDVIQGVTSLKTLIFIWKANLQFLEIRGN